MKNKLLKIWGVILALSLLASLLIMAAPTAAATLSYSPLTTPNIAPSNQISAGTDCSIFAQAPDGKTMFIYDNIRKMIYRSTNSGKSWSRTNLGMGLNATNDQTLGPASTVVDMVVSPNYATDTTLVVATRALPTNQVFRSINGGSGFGQVGDLSTLVVAPSALTSIDYTQYYSGGDAILVGYADTTGYTGTGGVALFTTTGLAWTNQRIGTIAADTLKVVVTVATVGITTFQVVYVDQSGNAAETTTSPLNVIPAGSIVGTEVAVTLNAGDTGARDVTNVTTVLSVATAGAFRVRGGVAAAATNAIYGTYTVTGAATGTFTDVAVGGTPDVLDVAFSPNHRVDAEMLALMMDFTTTYLQTKFANYNWGDQVTCASLGSGATTYNRPTSGTLAFPTDYDWSANNKTLVGTAGDADPLVTTNNNNDVYIVSGVLFGTGSNSRFTDLNMLGQNSTAEVRSIAMKGNLAGGKVLVGQYGSSAIYRTTDPSASSVTWYYSIKNPSGIATVADYVTVAWSPTSDSCYAATTNNNQTLVWAAVGTPSAFSMSTDGGINFDGMSMIDIDSSTNSINNMYIIDFAASSDAKTMYIIIYVDVNNSGAGNPYAVAAPSANDLSLVFKSVDSGTSWVMVWWGRSSASAERFRYVAVSPKYATDSTVYVVEQTSTRIWKSSTGGTSFVGLTNPAPINAFYAVDGSTYYTGTINGVAPAPGNGFYKSGRWTSPTLTSAIKSLAIAADNTIYAGSVNGGVSKSMDDGASFVPVGGSEMGAGNNIYIAVDKDGKTLYAGSDGAAGTGGLYRWTSTSIVWERIDSGYTVSAAAAPVTTSVAADAVTIAVDAATQIFTIAVTNGAFDVAVDTTSTGAVPAIAYNPATKVYTVTAAAATNVVRITCLVSPSSAIVTETSGTGVALTLTKIDAETTSDITAPATIAASASASVVLPDAATTTTTTGTTTSGALLCTAAVTAPDGTLYAANQAAGAGIRRSVNPTATSDVLRGFESVLRDLNGPLAGGMLQTLDLVVGSNKLFAVATGMWTTVGTVPISTAYGSTRVAAFDDVVAIPSTLGLPKDAAVTPGTAVTLSWAKIDSPVTLTYQVQVSTDSSFANLVYNNVTIGTSMTVSNFTPGTTYWWRVRVSPAATLPVNVPGAGEVDLDIASKWSVGWTFMPELGMISAGGQVGGPTLQSPTYGDETVIRRPTFSWLAVPGADSYELQLATNPFFAMPTIKAPLSHTTWTWDEDLTYGTTYYWRVRAVKAGNVFSPWAESLFTIQTQPVPEKPPVVVTQAAPQPAPVINLPTPVVNIPAQAPPSPSPITPVVIWVIIIIGAILVIAVIVLIVRTRRVP